MAYKPKQVLHFLLVFTILLAVASHVVAGREILENSKNRHTKQPQSVIHSDGTFVIPGIGRFMMPRPGTGFNPFTYNPVTGTSGGGLDHGAITGGGPGSGVGAPRNYIPGGDDTFIPNPGVEIPIPGRGGSSLTPTHP